MAIVQFRECRALHHAWERMDGPPEDWRRPDSPYWTGARYVVHLRCLRCKTWRHVAMTKSGAPLRSSYTYVDGYLMPRGEPPLNRDRLRLWLAVPSRWK